MFLRSFAVEADFHGFRHVAAAVGSKSAAWKWFWIAVMVMCGGGFAYQTTLAFANYFEGKVATQYTVRQNASLKVPDLVICIPARFDKERMKRAGLTEEFVKYASLGFIFAARPLTTGIDTASTAASLQSIANYTPEFEKTVDEKGSTYEDLMNSILFDCTDLNITCFKSGSTKLVSCCEGATRFYGAQGLCWRIEGPQQYIGGQGFGILVNFRLPRDRYYHGAYPMAYQGATLQFSFDGNADSNVVALPTQSRTEVAVDATHGQYLSTAENPCAQNPPPIESCIMDCIFDTRLATCPCRAIDVPTKGNETRNNLPICTPAQLILCWIKLFDNGDIDTELFVACSRADRCRHPCRVWHYGKTVSSYRLDIDETKKRGLDVFNEQTILIDVFYARLQLIQIDQYKSMTPEDLFGIVGGLMGLWLGGSMIAITHVICFWLRGCASEEGEQVQRER